MTPNGAFLARLMHAMQEYDQACLLSLLLSQNAEVEPLRTSATVIAERYLGGLLDRKRVQRATDRLVRAGILGTRVHPRTWTEYRVNAEAVVELLKRPLPDTPYLPGLSDQPIPFIERFEAMVASQPLSSEPDRSTSPSPTEEPT